MSTPAWGSGPCTLAKPLGALAQGFKEVLAHYFPWLHEVPKDHHISHGMSEDLNTVAFGNKSWQGRPNPSQVQRKDNHLQRVFLFPKLKTNR